MEKTPVDVDTYRRSTNVFFEKITHKSVHIIPDIIKKIKILFS